jgi:hypothetical protein|tara:strand:- start:276 stop:398 length:123 start_codon:yes stop_codon:yes gene_type:complete
MLTEEQAKEYARKIEFLYTREDYGKVKSEKEMISIHNRGA